MRVTVEIDESVLKDVMRFTGEKRKGAAVAKMATEACQLKKRMEITEKFMTGEWTIDLEQIDRRKDDAKRKRWFK
jgi:Arc/MetJ family transcription regulator